MCCECCCGSLEYLIDTFYIQPYHKYCYTPLL